MSDNELKAALKRQLDAEKNVARTKHAYQQAGSEYDDARDDFKKALQANCLQRVVIDKLLVELIESQHGWVVRLTPVEVVL